MKVFGRKSYGSFDHSLFNRSPYHDYGTNPEYQLHVFPRLFGSESFLTHLLQLQAPVHSQRPGGGGEPGTGLYEDSPANEKQLHLTSAKMCMFEDSRAAPEFF